MLSYNLEDVVDRMMAGDETIEIPGPSDLEKLQCGDSVKVIFLFGGEKKERMWIELEDAVFPFYRGLLLNNSYYDENLCEGAEISLEAQHICDIFIG